MRKAVSLKDQGKAAAVLFQSLRAALGPEDAPRLGLPETEDSLAVAFGSSGVRVVAYQPSRGDAWYEPAGLPTGIQIRKGYTTTYTFRPRKDGTVNFKLAAQRLLEVESDVVAQREAAQEATAHLRRQQEALGAVLGPAAKVEGRAVFTEHLQIAPTAGNEYELRFLKRLTLDQIVAIQRVLEQ